MLFILVSCVLLFVMPKRSQEKARSQIPKTKNPQFSHHTAKAYVLCLCRVNDPLGRRVFIISVFIFSVFIFSVFIISVFIFFVFIFFVFTFLAQEEC